MRPPVIPRRGSDVEQIRDAMKMPDLRIASFIALALSLGASGCFDPQDPLAGTDSEGQTEGPQEMGGTIGASEDTGPDDGDTTQGDDDDDDATGGDDDDDDSVGDDDDDDDDATGGDDDDDDDDDDSESTGGDDDDDDDDDDATGDTGEPVSCAMGSTCMAIPAGFIGPIAVDTTGGGAALPACGGEYGSDAFVGYQGLTAGAAQCTCDCADPTDLECPAATLNQYPDNGVNCAILIPDNVHNMAPGCNDLPFYDDVRFRLNMPDLDLTGVTCDPSFSETVPEAQWATQLGACEPAAELETCDAGTCVPDLPGAAQQLCVWAPGDVECSGDVFTEREVIYDDVVDTRGCSECSCGDAEGSCDAEVTLRAGEGCSAGSPGGGGPGQCFAVETPVRSGELDVTGPDVGCDSQGGTPQGQATPSGATTVCCTG